MSVLAFYAAIGVDLPDRPGEVPVSCFRDGHDDRSPSATVNTESGLWHCHACGVGGGPFHAAAERGCTPAEAMALVKQFGLGVKPEDHDPDDDRRALVRPRETRMAMLPTPEEVAGWRSLLLNDAKLLERLKELRGWTRKTIESLGIGYDPNERRIVFPIHNAEGALVNIERYLPGERNGSKKTLVLTGRPREMFPAPEAINSDTIWIFEGAQDAIAAHEFGLPATSIPGTGNTGKATPERFTGRRVIVCMDCDDEGRKASHTLAEALVGHAAEVKVIDLAPERDDGYDVGDLVVEASHNGGLEAAKVKLLKLAKAAEPLATKPTPASTLTDFTQIRAKPVRWLSRDRIALGKITAESGRPKIGKGLYYSYLAAAVTRGELEGDLHGKPRNAILVTTEDEPGDTLKPRLMAAGADLSRVFIFQMGSKDEPVPFRVPQDADELARRVEQTDAALVVIDPLLEFMDGKVDSHKSQPVRQAIAAIRQLVQGRDCAVLAIFHLNKGVSTDPLLRTEASAAFTQVVRGGLMVGHDPDDPEGEDGSQRVVAVSSTNLAAHAPSLVYRIETKVVTGDTGESITTARMVQIGESSASGHDLLRGVPDAEEQTAQGEAEHFLRVELAEGAREAGEMENLARKIGIAKTTLWRARRAVGIEPNKDAFGGPWMWALPPDGTPAEEASRTEDSTFDGVESSESLTALNPVSEAGFTEDSTPEDSILDGGGLESSPDAPLEPIWQTAPTTPPEGSS